MSLANKIKRKLFQKAKEKIQSDRSPQGVQFTIGEICDKLHVPLPDEFADRKDQVVTDAVISTRIAPAGSAFMDPTTRAKKLTIDIKAANKQKLAVIFADRKAFEQVTEVEPEMPVILLDDCPQQIYDFFRPYRDKYPGKVVTITGSVGKTTTRIYMGNILKKHARSYVNEANKNSRHSIMDNVLKKMDSKYQYYVQEVGATSVGTIEADAYVLHPDIAVVTNIKEHHISAYGSIENVFYDKMQLVEQLNDGGVAVVNFDDERLASYDYKCRVVSFGIETDKEVDYRAVNIVSHEDQLEMDVQSKDGTVHLKANLAGEYNAYNLLAAFAVGKLAGANEKDMVQVIRDTKMTGTRQNMTSYSSHKFFMDCYNVAFETILNSVDIISKVKPEGDGRVIAIVGAENKLGDVREEKTRELGVELAKAKVDQIVCFGTSKTTNSALNRFGDAKLLYETIKENGFENVILIDSFREMNKFLRQSVKKNDVILFKCITYLHLETAVDKVFGTTYCLKSKRVRDNIEMQEMDGFEGFIIKDMREALITKADESRLKARQLELGDTFAERNIFGIGKGVFSFSNMETADLGTKLKVIMPMAFMGCSNLKEIRFSENLRHIMEQSFKGCRNLEEIHLSRRILQIDAKAFEGCSRLSRVYIPRSADVRIEENAFPDGVEVIRT